MIKIVGLRVLTWSRGESILCALKGCVSGKDEWILPFRHPHLMQAEAGGEPGNVGWKPPLFSGGWIAVDSELREKKLAADLANGRLAMMAIIGMFFQERR